MPHFTVCWGRMGIINARQQRQLGEKTRGSKETCVVERAREGKYGPPAAEMVTKQAKQARWMGGRRRR